MVTNNRKTTLEIKDGELFIVTWCDGSQSEYNDYVSALSAIEDDYNKFFGDLNAKFNM